MSTHNSQTTDIALSSASTPKPSAPSPKASAAAAAAAASPRKASSSPKAIVAEMWRNLFRHFNKNRQEEEQPAIPDNDATADATAKEQETTTPEEDADADFFNSIARAPSTPPCTRLSSHERRHLIWNHMAQFELSVSSRMASFS